MTAKEMFEKLGYTYTYYPYTHTIECFLDTDEDFHFTNNTINFYKKHKKVEINGYLSTEELQAINKQIEELGWNRDE